MLSARRLVTYLMAAWSGYYVMAIELLSGRILAPSFGNNPGKTASVGVLRMPHGCRTIPPKPLVGKVNWKVKRTSGTLPNTGAWVSGTAKVNPASRPITVAVEVVTAGTNTIATCVVAISPDNVTYTTLGTPGCSAAVNNLGAITLLTNVPLPQGWYIKLTFANCTVAASIYF